MAIDTSPVTSATSPGLAPVGFSSPQWGHRLMPHLTGLLHSRQTLATTVRPSSVLLRPSPALCPQNFTGTNWSLWIALASGTAVRMPSSLSECLITSIAFGLQAPSGEKPPICAS